MKEFEAYLDQNDILNKITNHYQSKNNSEFDLDIIKKILLKSMDSKNIDEQCDIFGKFYEKIVKYDKRKDTGEFFTPPSIVEYILSNVDYLPDNTIGSLKLIDLSCGTGSFLIYAVKHLVNNYFIHNKRDIIDISCRDAEIIIERVKNNIYGIEINPNACILCQINIQYVLFDLYKKIKEYNKDFIFPIFNILNENAMELPFSSTFDIVVGNPPYVFIRDLHQEQKEFIEKSDFKGLGGQYDLYQVFLELAVRFLKDGGKLGYIVPDSILALTNKASIRKYIYETTKIKEIFYTGPKFEDPVVSNIIIMLQKSSNEEERLKNMIKIKKSSSNQNLIREISQETLKKWNFQFLVNLNDTDIFILNYLSEKFQKVEDIMNKDGFEIILVRGVELNKKGKVIYCNVCKKYMPLPKKSLFCKDCNSKLDSNSIETIILDKIPNRDQAMYKPFLYSINRYHNKIYKYIDTTKNGISYKNFEDYRDRIVIRQLNQKNLICASYDKNLSVTSQSFYNLKIKKSPIPEFNNLYLLGIINSMLLSFYFIKAFGSYKTLFPRILIEKIKHLPIKIPENSSEKEYSSMIASGVQILIENGEQSKAIADKIQMELDSLVFDLYEISQENREYILNFLKNL